MGSGVGLPGLGRGWGSRCNWGSPPSSSASVSDSSLSTSLLSWVPTNSLVQIIKAVSAPPTVSSTESLCSHLTLVTCALCPTYFLNLACWPCKARNWQLPHLVSHHSRLCTSSPTLFFRVAPTGYKRNSSFKRPCPYISLEYKLHDSRG